MPMRYFCQMLIGTVFALILSACASNGVVSGEHIDRKAAEQWAQILKTVPLTTDRAASERVAFIAVNLLTAAAEDPAEWQIAILEGPDVFNAFALPNKRIGVFTGLINHVENDDQLASVIGHEIAHVRLNHTHSRVNRSVAPNVLIGVANLPGKLSGIPVIESTGNIVGGVISTTTVLPYNRAQELDADKIGVSYAYEAGYDPFEAAELWRSVNAQASPARRMTPEFLSTHPSNAHRIRELDKVASALVKK